MQNYIDNTGVQVADVVVGFLYVEQTPPALDCRAGRCASDRASITYCWDVYARASQWYDAGQAEGLQTARWTPCTPSRPVNNEVAAMADLIATTVLRRHLETMERLDIRYDFLPRESEILQLHFWDSAFQQLKEKGVIYKETAGQDGLLGDETAGHTASRTAEDSEEGRRTKVIVRSNGTVVYEGKDIAYHLWKFGLLGRDFGYPLLSYLLRRRHDCWISADARTTKSPAIRTSAAQRHL